MSRYWFEVYYLKSKGWTVELCLSCGDIQKLRSEYIDSLFPASNAQKWLNVRYLTLKEKENCEELNIGVREDWNPEGIKERLERSLCLEGFFNLEKLNCGWQKITDLNLSNCPNLRELFCFENGLTSLNLSKNIKLVELNCSGNLLTDLDLRQNTKLTKLSCSDNKLINLDLSKNTQIREIFCPYNQLTNSIFFNVKNGFFEGKLEDLKLIFQANIERTSFLESTIKDLKERIVKAYCYLTPESDLLQKLIKAELIYRKAKEQNLPSYKLGKERDQIKSTLEKKMSEEQMEEVELILTDCEKLVINDLELEAIIARTTRVIEEAKFRMININVNEKIEIAEEEKQFLENLLSVLQEHMKGRKSINALGKFLEGFQTAKETLQTKISEKKFWSLFEKLEEETKLEGAVEARMEVLDKKN